MKPAKTPSRRPSVRPRRRPAVGGPSPAPPSEASATDLTHVEDARAVLARAFDTYQKSAEGPLKRLRVYAASPHPDVRRASETLLAAYAPESVAGGRR